MTIQTCVACLLDTPLLRERQRMGQANGWIGCVPYAAQMWISNRSACVLAAIAALCCLARCNQGSGGDAGTGAGLLTGSSGRRPAIESSRRPSRFAGDRRRARLHHRRAADRGPTGRRGRRTRRAHHRGEGRNWRSCPARRGIGFAGRPCLLQATRAEKAANCLIRLQRRRD